MDKLVNQFKKGFSHNNTEDNDFTGTISIPNVGKMDITTGYYETCKYVFCSPSYTNSKPFTQKLDDCVKIVLPMFLSIDYIHPSLPNPIPLVIPPEYYCINSYLFTPPFVYHLLKNNTDIQTLPPTKLLDYRLNVMDSEINCLEFLANQCVKITGHDKYNIE